MILVIVIVIIHIVFIIVIISIMSSSITSSISVCLLIGTVFTPGLQYKIPVFSDPDPGKS